MNIAGPHDFYPQLTTEKLNSVGSLIYTARMECLETYEEDRGDTAWSLGCRSTEWVREALRKNADQKGYEWLSIELDAGQKFVFSINGILCRQYKDNSKNLSLRVCKPSEIENSKQLKFSFTQTVNSNDNILWRFIIKTNVTNEVLRIIFVGINQEHDIVCEYEIPLKQNITKIYDASEVQEKGIELSAPIINKKSEQKKQKKEN